MGKATANDVELASALWKHNAQEAEAVGIHVVLQPYGVEPHAWNGENPEYIAKMTAAEVESINAGGIYACVKHFITRGGDYGFADAKSNVVNTENYMYCWEAAIAAGAKWIMTNSAGTGLDDLNVDFSKKTMSYLRDTLGFDGVVITDWGCLGYAAKGIDEDGVDLGALTMAERAAYVIGNGVDQLGINNLTLDETKSGGSSYYINDMLNAVETGLLSEDRLNEANRRLLRTKFELGLFENPYEDPAVALELAASSEYIAQPWEIVDVEGLNAARNAEVVEMERKLEAESAVLVKNDGVLPLKEGTKVYIDSTNGTAIESYKKYIANYGTVVDAMAEADVLVLDLTQLNDAAELMLDDAEAAGKPIVAVTNCADPNTLVMESADAVLFMNFNRTPDHGRAAEGMILTTEPSIYAELLFGVREPSGIIVKEIARDAEMEKNQWKDLAGDLGVSMDVRMILEAMMLSSEDKSTPNNFSDALLPYEFSMRYGQEGSFRYAALNVPQTIVEERVHLFLDMYTTMEVSVNATQKAGEPFTIYCVLLNSGSDDVENVQVTDNGVVIAEKCMAVHGGSWRIVKMDITLDTVGEHVIALGDMSTTITVE